MKYIKKTGYKNKWGSRLSQLKYRAKKQGLECSLTIEELESLWTDVCPIFNTQILFQSTRGDNNIGEIDRIDNSKGYTIDNCSIISRRANRLKSNMTVAEIEQLLKYMKKVK